MIEDTAVPTVEIKEEPVDELCENSGSAYKGSEAVFSVEEAEVRGADFKRPFDPYLF